MEQLINKLDNNEISNKNFKEIVNDLLERDIKLDDLLKEKNIQNVVDDSKVLELINKIIDENNDAVNDYLTGNERSLKYLMGQVMKESKGSVNPKLANDLLINELNNKK